MSSTDNVSYGRDEMIEAARNVVNEMGATERNCMRFGNEERRIEYGTGHLCVRIWVIQQGWVFSRSALVIESHWKGAGGAYSWDHSCYRQGLWVRYLVDLANHAVDLKQKREEIAKQQKGIDRDKEFEQYQKKYSDIDDSSIFKDK